MAQSIVEYSLSQYPTVVASVAAAVAIGAAVLATSSSRSQGPKTADGRPLRKAHTLPSPYPVIGDLIAYATNAERLHLWMNEVCHQFNGEPWQLRIVGQNPTTVFITPEACEDILITQFDNFPRGEYGNEVLSGLFGQSIITYDGDHWYHQRKAAARFFTGKALRQCMMNTMRKNIAQMNEVIDASIVKGTTFDLSNLLGQFTLQTFTEVGLGVDLRWIGNEEPHPLHGVAEYGSPAIIRRLRTPKLQWRLEQFFGIGLEGQLTRSNKEMHSFFQTLIDQSLEAATRRQQQRQQEQPESEDTSSDVKSIVELFLEHSADDKGGLQSENFTDFVITFVLAAQDTSAVTLMRFFLLLTNYPHVRQKIAKEMTEVLGSMEENGYLSMDHVNQLVYLEATIKETLRLYPTVPVVQKIAAVDTVVCGDVPIRKNEAVCIHMYAMARNTKVWGPDAAEFKPERWIDENGGLKNEPLTKFTSFSCGPRVCIGMKLGMLELRIVAANLLRRYAFDLAVPNDGSHTIAITLLLKDPLVMKAKRV